MSQQTVTQLYRWIIFLLYVTFVGHLTKGTQRNIDDLEAGRQADRQTDGQNERERRRGG